VETVDDKEQKLGQIILRIAGKEVCALDLRQFLDGFDEFSGRNNAVFFVQHLPEQIPFDEQGGIVFVFQLFFVEAGIQKLVQFVGVGQNLDARVDETGVSEVREARQSAIFIFFIIIFHLLIIYNYSFIYLFNAYNIPSREMQ
jgi:hypothetical protein